MVKIPTDAINAGRKQRCTVSLLLHEVFSRSARRLRRDISSTRGSLSREGICSTIELEHPDKTAVSSLINIFEGNEAAAGLGARVQITLALHGPEAGDAELQRQWMPVRKHREASIRGQRTSNPFLMKGGLDGKYSLYRWANTSEWSPPRGW